MYTFQICGYSKSGKTTLIKKLIKQFSDEGFKVASIKDIHFEDFRIETLYAYRESVDTGVFQCRYRFRVYLTRRRFQGNLANGEFTP